MHSPKLWAKNWHFTQNAASLCKNDDNIGFQEERKVFAKHWRGSPQIVIITLTPSHISNT
jgi:hypothetical protein